MNKPELWFQAVVAAVGGLFASIPALVLLLLLLQGMDIITGLVGAGIKGRLSSGIAFRGMSLKVMALLLVTTAGLMGWALQESTGVPTGVLVQVVAAFYCAHELLSIIENARNAGLPVPKALSELVSRISPEDGVKDTGAVERNG